ncbi:MAG: hypothetical protein DHS20C14_17670 [Phycisphaeraceae bacterium]|nr:MAG: hypothetical protein DHS20C14_17670 [Phycisphaeraceae bacterium]
MIAPALTLAWTPFIDPIDANAFWYLLIIPMAIGIALAFKAVRVGEMRKYPRHVAMMTAQIILGVVVLAIASFIVIDKLVPILTPMPAP